MSNTVFVFTSADKGIVDQPAVYSTLEKLWANERDYVISGVGFDDDDNQLTGDFDNDWNILCDAMGESDYSADISHCQIDGETLYTI